MIPRERVLAHRLAVRRSGLFADKVEADALGDKEITQLLLRLGGRQVIRKPHGDAVVFTTIVDNPAFSAYRQAEALLSRAKVPYTTDSRPQRCATEIESVSEDAKTIINTYTCPDEDADIILFVHGLGEQLSLVTLISRVF